MGPCGYGHVCGPRSVGPSGWGQVGGVMSVGWVDGQACLHEQNCHMCTRANKLVHGRASKLTVNFVSIRQRHLNRGPSGQEGGTLTTQPQCPSTYNSTLCK